MSSTSTRSCAEYPLPCPALFSLPCFELSRREKQRQRKRRRVGQKEHTSASLVLIVALSPCIPSFINRWPSPLFPLFHSLSSLLHPRLFLLRSQTHSKLPLLPIGSSLDRLSPSPILSLLVHLSRIPYLLTTDTLTHFSRALYCFILSSFLSFQYPPPAPGPSPFSSPPLKSKTKRPLESTRFCFQ